MQLEIQQKLVESGLRQLEIGEIASWIAQLYFGLYMRTSQANYLHEAFAFYDAVLSHNYSNNKVEAGDLSLATKQLCLISRFLTVCLLLNRCQMVHQLLSQLMVLLEELQEDLPGHSGIVQLEPHPDSLASPAKRNLRLRDAVLSSYHHYEVRYRGFPLTLSAFIFFYRYLISEFYALQTP